MTTVMTVLLLAVLLWALQTFNRLCSDRLTGQSRELQVLRQKASVVESEKDRFVKRKLYLQSESFRIHSMYEALKEVTQSRSTEDAFLVFRSHLNKHLSYSNVRLLPPEEKAESLRLKKSGTWDVLSLKGKRKVIGYLAIEGLQPRQRETASLLANQFALVLNRIQLYSKLEKVAITDGLTAVHTRHYAMERLQEEILRCAVRSGSTAVLMIDADHFKSVNDKHGHLTGDQVLKYVGETLMKMIREVDIAGRYGGEEFIVILPDTDKKGAVLVAGRIRERIEEGLVEAYDVSVRVTVSIGVAAYPIDAGHMSELVDKADWALYRAKKLGRNRVCTFGVYE